MSTPPVDSAVASSAVHPPQSRGLERNLRVVAAGGGATFASKLFMNALRFVTAIWLARLLGADQLGLYSLATSALTLGMGIALFGLDAGVVRYIAVQTAREDETGVWGTIQIGLGVSLLASAVLGTLLFAFAQAVAIHLFDEPRLTYLLQLASVFIPLMVINDMLGNALKGFKKIQWSSLALFVIQPITRLVLIAIFALVGMNAAWAVVTYGLATLTASGVMIYYLQKHFGLKRPFAIRRGDFRELMRFSFPVWLSGLMARFQSNIQSFFLGSMGTIAGVGIFSVANQITMVSGEFSSSINTASKPIIAELHERNDHLQMSSIYQMTNKIVMMVQLPIFLVMVLLPGPLLSIFGESFTGGATALIILAAADLMNTATGMGGVIIDMTGYTRLKLVNSGIRLVFYIVFDLLFIPKWGLVGAALAVLAGEGMVNLLRMLQVFVIFRMLPYNLSFFKPLAATLAALGAVMGMRALFPSELTLVYAAIQAAVLFLVYGGINLLLGLSAEEWAMIKNLVRYLPGKKNR
jgi:O-antigen/teichoic acid export membrane protein